MNFCHPRESGDLFWIWQDMKPLKYYFPLISIITLTACATSPMIQPQINSLVVAHRYDLALQHLENNQQSYGEHNRLLYYLDYGYTLHVAGDYEKSIESLNKAKKMYDVLFTKSLTNQATTWLINDNVAPYRGEDFERVMINIVQALNYAALGDYEEALVEARDVDSTLRVINQQYRSDQQNVYKEDAFARFLMGILYEMRGRAHDLEDAWISYRKALEIYEQDYESEYAIAAPDLLKRNFTLLSKFLNKEMSFSFYEKISQMGQPTFKDKQQLAEVYVVRYVGLSPIKHQADVLIPLPRGYVAKLAFPLYDKRTPEIEMGVIKAVSDDGVVLQFKEEIAQDISAIAIKNLEQRRLRVLAKATIRSAGKYILAREIENSLRENDKRNAASAFRYVSTLYNITSEQADLRSWQTLPGAMTVTRLLLNPGSYEFFVDDESIAKYELESGQKKIIVHR